MQRLLKYVLLWGSLALLGLVQTDFCMTPIGEEIPMHVVDRVGQPLSEDLSVQTGSLSPQNEDLGRLLMQSLSGDRLNTYAQYTGRISSPVVRLHPYGKMTFGVYARMSEPVALQRDRVQRKSEACIRAALDESGYYVFALRKIII